MTGEEKKAFLLLNSIIFHYHGLDEDEQELLDETADSLQAQEELQWASDFIAQDYSTAFDRARDYLKQVMDSLEREKRLEYMRRVWDANNQKGYISEMEAMGMLQVAKDWGIEAELMKMVRS